MKKFLVCLLVLLSVSNICLCLIYYFDGFYAKKTESPTSQVLAISTLSTADLPSNDEQMVATTAVDDDMRYSASFKTENEYLGTKGRLYIPEINFSVALYHANIIDDVNYDAQRIVDNANSAAFFSLENKLVIADHNYQGFSKLNDLTLGTYIYIKELNGSTTYYQLREKLFGKNTMEDLVDSYGQSIINREESLIIYTCYTSDEDILLTLWEKIDEKDT